MSRSRACTIGALLVAWLGVGGATLRARPARPPAPPQASNFVVEGKISRHSPGKLTISTEENIIFHASYDDKTEIKRRDGSAASPKDFRIGEKIKIEGDLTESGEIVAQKIELQGEKK